MKFAFKSRYTGAVLFVADIDCDDDASFATKRGLAILWAVRSGAVAEGVYVITKCDPVGMDNEQDARFRWL